LWQGNQLVGDARDHRYSTPLVDVVAPLKTYTASTHANVALGGLIGTKVSAINNKSHIQYRLLIIIKHHYNS